MTSAAKESLKACILNQAVFISATFKGKQKGNTPAWQRVSLRPVKLKGVYYVQISFFDGKHDLSKNFAGDDLAAQLDILLAEPFNSVVARAATEKLRLQITKKGKAILHREKVAANLPPESPDFAHDHAKGLIFPVGRPNPFLQAVGISTADGKIKARMQAKFWQINRFLELAGQALAAEPTSGAPLRVIDCGCGNAYLTFATYYFLTKILGRETRLIGIDVNQALIDKRNAQVTDMGWSGLEFHRSAIIDYRPDAPPDIVLALHACDTATDEALAQAVRWGSRFIFSAPCCHHHLQAQWASAGKTDNPACKAIFRHGILKERLGDILTDTLRAHILRLMGYRTDVVEFVSGEHTAKNLMIRARKTARPPEPSLVREYHHLRTFWQVTPWLETLLGDDFRQVV